MRLGDTPSGQSLLSRTRPCALKDKGHVQRENRTHQNKRGAWEQPGRGVTDCDNWPGPREDPSPSATLSLLLVCNHRLERLADKETWKATEEVDEVDIQPKSAAASWGQPRQWGGCSSRAWRQTHTSPNYMTNSFARTKDEDSLPLGEWMDGLAHAHFIPTSVLFHQSRLNDVPSCK